MPNWSRDDLEESVLEVFLRLFCFSMLSFTFMRPVFRAVDCTVLDIKYV